MNYQVVYESRTGNTRAVAEAIMSVLPKESAKLADIQSGIPSKDADVYCIGYGVHSSTCSLKLLDFLELLNGRTILLFATCGLEPTEAYRKLLERNIEPFLPDHCDYRGMFLCRGAIPEEGGAALRQRLQEEGDEENLRRLDGFVASARPHPDPADLDAVRRFVREALRIG